MRRWMIIGAGIILFQIAVLFVMGQPALCECGYIKFWEGTVLSEGNSQHLSDWYTPSHVIHGFLFYLLFWFLFPRASVWLRLVLAIGLEASWEILENTPWVIDRYREQALAQGYVGDSVLNSTMDTLAMVAGFFIARRIPIVVSVIAVLLMEVFVGAMIRDNLLLNVVQLLYPLEFVSEWQSAQ